MIKFLKFFYLPSVATRWRVRVKGCSEVEEPPSGT